MSAAGRHRRWQPVPPSALDPILARVETLQRRRARIRACRPGGVLGVALCRHSRGARELADGTRIVDGHLIGEIHIYPATIRDLVEREDLPAVLREARRDLAALARWADRQSDEARPVAYRAEGIIVPVARRLGFEVRPSRRTPWTLVREWHFRWLLTHWSPDGRRRLERGHAPLRLTEVWLSGADLRAHHGPSGSARAAWPRC